VTASTPSAALWRPSAGSPAVPRRALTFVRLPMPALARGQLLAAVRLQLTQYMPAGPFGFICRSQTGGTLLVWAWAVDAASGSPRRGGGWAECALDEPAQGLRLVRRSEGFEAQQWSGGELLHSRWFETPPGDADWERFTRGCGANPNEHALPQPAVARTLRRPARGWIAGDNLPAADPWQGWHWQAALLLLGTVAAAALGVDLQARQQLRIDTERLQALRGSREASLQARARYERASSELDALRALVPRLSQLELLERVTASGIFAPAPAGESPTAAKAPASSAPGLPPSASPAGTAGARMLDWDYRNGQLKITLELPEGNVTLLDVTRKLEAVPGLGALRVGQDSASNALTLSANIAELAPPDATPRSGGTAP